MLAEVKKCADSHDIDGLKYIFVDSLDVDPTFDTYREDYEYCKKIPGIFDTYIELTPMVEDISKWTTKYWEQLKSDLTKNFSEKRFEHMISVAKVVYSDKVDRLKAEREEKAFDLMPDISKMQVKIPKPILGINRKVVLNENHQGKSQTDSNNLSKSDLEKKRIEDKRRALVINNSRIEAEEKERRERREALRREEIEKQGIHSTVNESKKVMRIALAVIIAVVLVVLIIVVLL